jgi:hypothetical protein
MHNIRGSTQIELNQFFSIFLTTFTDGISQKLANQP